MQILDFDYALPAESIAQRPTERRDASRLLDATGEDLCHRHTADLPQLVRPGDVIVVNNTRVLPARLRLRRPTGGATEVFLLEPAGNAQTGAWHALVKPSRKCPPGTELTSDTGATVEVGADLGAGRRIVTSADGDLQDLAAAEGTVPLPPYITETLHDPERYQTVYAEREVSVAAPTAGLHLTAETLDACRDAGAQVVTVELAVGIGTFRPITVDDITDHVMHEEFYRVPEATWESVQSAGRVIAIGTTSVRALESAATRQELAGRTDLFISPGYSWKVVDTLFTNFHQPRSSLLVMLAAFAGPRWRSIYEDAQREAYRFLSFGDAMIVNREGTPT